MTSVWSSAGVNSRDDGRVRWSMSTRASAAGNLVHRRRSSPFELKHVANSEARTVAHNLAHPGRPAPVPARLGAPAVFTDPEIATVGARSQDLAGQRPFVQATQAVPRHRLRMGPAGHQRILRLYADPATGRLLGAHILGYQASLLIQPLIQAMSSGQSVASMARGPVLDSPGAERGRGERPA